MVSARLLHEATRTGRQVVDHPGEFQADDWGGRVRAALAERTGARTVPQVFVGGELVGGCTEVLGAWDDGQFQDLLRASGAPGGRILNEDRDVRVEVCGDVAWASADRGRLRGCRRWSPALATAWFL